MWTACGTGWRGWALASTGTIPTPGGMTGDSAPQWTCHYVASLASNLQCCWCWHLLLPDIEGNGQNFTDAECREHFPAL